MKKNIPYLFLVIIIAICSGCKKVSTGGDNVLKFDLHSNQLIDVPQRNLDAQGKISLKPEQTLHIEVDIPGAPSAEGFPKIYIHAGNPASNNPVLYNVIVSHYHDKHVEGEVPNTRQSLLDSIWNKEVDLYVTVTSTASPLGIVRGQINKAVTNAYTINLSGTNVVPAVSTTATGTAILRVTSDNKLYSNIMVTNIEATDALQTAHIYKASAGANGPLLLNLADNASEFGVPKAISLDDTKLQALRNDALYINVNSNTSPTGKLRGQIR